MNKETKIILLSSFFPDELYNEILKNSIGMPHTANDNFLRSLLKGYIQCENVDLAVINAPLIGSFPFFYRKFIVNSIPKVRNKSYSFISLGYINITFIKSIMLFYKLRRELFKEMKNSFLNDTVIQVYGAHIPMMRAAISVKRIFKNVRINLILPDLPEFYSHNSNVIWKFRSMLTTDYYRLIKKFDDYVLFTVFMAQRLNLSRLKFLVIEGIVNSNDFEGIQPYYTGKKRIVLYAGTLAKRYGIMDLVDAFNLIELTNVELWICGSGDASGVISDLSLINPKFRYFGNVNRLLVQSLMLSSKVLVNPRKNSSEYTKYSFPSKTMEYLFSGIPVVMYKLDGIPSDYDDFINYVAGNNLEDLKNAIESVLEKDIKYKQKAFEAKNFVALAKNEVVQANKIVQFLVKNTFTN